MERFVNSVNALPNRHCSRDADRAVFGGVCAGLAGHFGLNLKVTRILTCVAFFMFMPIAIIAYVAAVFLVPSASRKEFETTRPKTTAEEIQRRCRDIDERLIRLEKHVTSSRFQLAQEIGRL